MKILRLLSIATVLMLVFATPMFAQGPVVTEEAPAAQPAAPSVSEPAAPAAEPQVTEEALAPVVTEEAAAVPAAPQEPAVQVTEEAAAPVVPEEPTAEPASVDIQVTEEPLAPVVAEEEVAPTTEAAAEAVASEGTVEGQGPPGNWSSDVNLINLDTGGAASIVVKRYGQWAGSGTADTGTDINVASATCTLPIPAGGSCYFNPGTLSSYPTGAGAIVVTSDRNLAAASTVANSSFGTAAYASDAYAGLGQDGVSTSMFAPIIMGNLGVWNTRVAVQNAGTVAADVTITYIGTGAPAAATVTALPPGMMALVEQQTSAFSNFNGSALVTSAQPIAVVVDEFKSSGGVLVTYTGLPLSKAAKTVYLPGYINQGVWATDFTVVNTEGTAGTVNVAFAGSAVTLSGPIAANGSQYVNLAAGVPSGWTGGGPASPYYGAATITCDRNIVVVYNIANSNGGSGQHALAYVGSGASAAGTKITVPIIENAYTAGWTTTFSVQTTDGTDTTLSVVYSGNKVAVCNPCSVNTASGRVTVNQGAGTHVPTGFLGGATITAGKSIVVIADQDLPGGLGDTAAGFPGIKIQ